MDRLIAKNAEAVASIKAIQDAINALDGKTVIVTVKYVTEGQPDDLQAATQFVKQVTVPGGGDNALGVMSDYMQDLVDEAGKANAAFDQLNQTTERLGEDGTEALSDLREALGLVSPQTAENL